MKTQGRSCAGLGYVERGQGRQPTALNLGELIAKMRHHNLSMARGGEQTLLDDSVRHWLIAELNRAEAESASIRSSATFPNALGIR